MPPPDLNTLPLPTLFQELARLANLPRFLQLVRDEDLGPDALDITSELAVDPTQTLRTQIRAREPGVLSGLAALAPIINAFDAALQVDLLASDGDHIQPGEPVATIEGRARDLLAVERPILNLLGRLSGVATRAASFVTAAGDHPAKVFDTRKTTPGLRHLEKYAVRCGGAHCHRLGLSDAVLVKDNHLATINAEMAWPQRVAEWSAQARARYPEQLRFFEVEVDTPEQLDALLALPAGTIDVILLDNMPDDALRAAVAQRNARQPDLLLEASGGITRQRIPTVAATGVDRISVGSLTHHAVSIDFGLDAV